MRRLSLNLRIHLRNYPLGQEHYNLARLLGSQPAALPEYLLPRLFVSTIQA
jgi:hypothetical protein